MVAVGKNSGHPLQNTLYFKNVLRCTQTSKVNDQLLPDVESCSHDLFKMNQLLLEALEEDAFVELDPVPSAASRCTLQATDVAASGELSQTVAKPQAVSNPALLPMRDAMPPGSAEKQAAEQSKLSYAVRYPFIGPLLENPINEKNQIEYTRQHALQRVCKRSGAVSCSGRHSNMSSCRA